MFPAIFSRAYHGFLFLFPAFATGYMFSRVYHGLHFFPAFATGYIFSRVCNVLHASYFQLCDWFHDDFDWHVS